MSLQKFKTKLLAISLFTASTCGTFALFGCVPLLAQLFSAQPKFELSLLQDFPPQTRASAVPNQSSHPATSSTHSHLGSSPAPLKAHSAFSPQHRPSL